MAKLRNRIVRNVPDVVTPTIMRGQLIHSAIKQINANTVAINSPRSRSDDTSGDALGANYQNNQKKDTTVEGEVAENIIPIGTKPYVVHYELRRTTSTVRVENPEDETQYVDVERIESILFLGSDGSSTEFNFSNTDI